MTATVDIITKRKVGIIGVPISAVVMKSDTTSGSRERRAAPAAGEAGEGNAAPKVDKKMECVFVKAGKKAKLRVIRTGIQDDTNIEVVSGLKKGDTVITGPYTTVSKELNPGDVVRIKGDSKDKDKKDTAKKD